jgi:hypothetical protein
VTFINFIKKHKLPLASTRRAPKAARILRWSKGYVLVGDNLYKRGSALGILIKCVRAEEGREILEEIHEGMWEACRFSHVGLEGFQIWVLLADGFGKC